MAGKSPRKWDGPAQQRVARRTVIFAGLALALLRIAFPDVDIDAVALGAICAALLAFITPAVLAALPMVKRVKFGSVELELREEISKLASEVATAREAAEDPGRPGRAVPEAAAQVEDVLREAAADPRAALLLLSARIEAAAREAAKSAGLGVANTNAHPRVLLAAMASEQIISPDVLPAFADFWAIRNKIAHGVQFEVPPAALYSLIDLGSDILKMIASSSPPDGSAP